MSGSGGFEFYVGEFEFYVVGEFESYGEFYDVGGRLIFSMRVCWRLIILFR